MLTAICTLFEKDYHYGVGALVNSLYVHGFRGIVWAGYRGNLPFWAQPLTLSEGYQEYKVAEGCAIRFVKLETHKHFGYYKPDFMWQLMENYCPEVEALFYFDPDIVNKRDWQYYEHWVNCGVALCGDSWYSMPNNHPTRMAWRKFVESHNFVCDRPLEHHYNAGFIGVPKKYQYILSIWQKLTDIATESGYIDFDDLYSHKCVYNYPYIFGDQSIMNMTLMVTDCPISTIGPEGMDFIPGGDTMSHAISPAIKPWRKKILLRGLQADAPTVTDKLYWNNAQTPIPLYSPRKISLTQMEIRIASGIGRFIRRPAM
ncbi:hypothetical protein [Calothrix sp. 336/3]|uniref:hypothetical protein n=1 Tax=Calothrix sp. 336/3 TaxID=1337936 RepID=UPI0004E3B7C8|nr:hypothetical protein [Calothrix sp. 336/3]AKG23395.1 hypothetical protein IJ00_20825 [Calothrix sp. 336/3]